MRSLLVFAIILLPGAFPIIAASDPPLCLFALMPQGAAKHTAIDQAASTYTLEERDYLIRTVAFEAAHETNYGKAAGAHVILNRKKANGVTTSRTW